MYLHRAGGWFCIIWALTTGLAKASSWELDPPLTCGETTVTRFESAPYSIEEQTDRTFIVSIPAGAYRFMAAGEPHLPFLVRRIAVPKGCVAEIEILNIEVSETNAPTIQPTPRLEARESPHGQHVEPAPASESETYRADTFWPPQLVEIDYASQGKQRWARVLINPVQYNPVRGILRWNKTIEARLVWRERPAAE